MWSCALRTETLTGPAPFTVVRSGSPSPAPLTSQPERLPAQCPPLSHGGLRLPSAWLLPAETSQASRPGSAWNSLITSRDGVITVATAAAPKSDTAPCLASPARF